MFAGLTFKIADAAERLRALELRCEIYTDELGHHGIDRFDERAHHLVVCGRDGELVAALRLIGPDQRPFDIEEFVDLAQIIGRERTPAQIGGFWIRRDYRSVKRRMLVTVGTLKLAHAFAQKHAFTDLVMYTYLRLCPLYRSAFFRSTGVAFDHPAWGTVHVMHLDMIALAKDRMKSHEPMSRLLFATDLPNFILD